MPENWPFATPSLFHSVDGRDLDVFTAGEMYNLYCEIGRRLFLVVNPTPEELEGIKHEMCDFNLGEEHFFDGDSGDPGTTAAYVYESREMADADQR